jgi:hypothetical protein
VPDDPGPPADRLAAAVAELYGAAPEEFTGRRGELAAAARAAGDRPAAKAIGALRRPTRAAWVVNSLARADPSAPSQLAELGAALGSAQQAGQAARLRELSAARWTLVDDLTSRALAAAGVADPPAALRLEVSETLSAALADPAAAADFAAGTLTKAVQWSGFGLAPADAGAGNGADGEPEASAHPEAGAGSGATAAEPRRKLHAVPPPRDAGSGGLARALPEAGRAPAPAGTKPAAGPEAAGTEPAARTTGRRGTAPQRETTAERRAAQAARQAEEARQQQAAAQRMAAEQAARRQEQYREAERAAAAAAATAAEAVAAEDRLEAEVRDLEQRLTPARDELAAARMRARRAEAAERRARQALDRLPRS